MHSQGAVLQRRCRGGPSIDVLTVALHRDERYVDSDALVEQVVQLEPSKEQLIAVVAKRALAHRAAVLRFIAASQRRCVHRHLSNVRSDQLGG
jgi:hypothetical protein